MQTTYRGLRLEQARDMIFDTLVSDYWYAIHTASGRTVLVLTTTGERAAEITTALSNQRDWAATEEWEEDPALTQFAARYPGEAEVPEYGDGEDWTAELPDDEFEAVVPFGAQTVSSS